MLKHAREAVTLALVLAPRARPDLEEVLQELGYELGERDDAVEVTAIVLAPAELDDQCLLDVRELRRSRPDAIIACVATSGLRRANAALAAGANAVIADAAALPLVFAAAGTGHVLLPRAAVEARGKGRPTLSQRERELLALVVLGMSNAAIARRLHITESTVKSHLSSAFAKLSVRRRSEAVEVILSDERLAAGIVSLPGQRDRLTLLRGPADAS